jgi:hypothetical protein
VDTPGQRRGAEAPQRSASARILPLARLALGNQEVWPCLHLGRGKVELLLLVPPAEGSGRLEPQPAPWLLHLLRGTLRWQGRYPLGASGDVSLCSLEDPAWLPQPAPDAHPARVLREALQRNRLTDDLPVLPNRGSLRGSLRVRQLAAEGGDDYAWLDPAAAAAFRAAARGPTWALVWAQDEELTPLALLQPATRFGFVAPRIRHLVSGTPADALPRQ